MAKGGVKLKVTGLDDVLTRLDTLSNKTSFYKTAVYSGAGVVADEMKRQIKSLKTTSEKGKRTDKRYIYPYERAVLAEAMGIAPIKDEETVNTKIGFDGYYQNKKGDKKPIPLLANSVNAGTSFLYKQPFISKTERTCRDKAVKSMTNKVEEIIEKEN